MKKEKISNILTLALCFALLLSFGIAIFIKPQKTFSEHENRALANFPRFNTHSLANGSFFSGISDFYTDQFPCRAVFTAIKSHSERTLLKCENGGIIFARGGYLIAKGTTDTEILKNNLLSVKDISNKTNATVFIIPRAIDVLSHTLPNTYGIQLEENDLDLIENELPNSIRVTDELRASARNGGYIWYKTDHHWSTEGAYIAYTRLAEHLGIMPYDRDSFTPETVSNDFLGTSFSKSGLYSADGDTVTLWRYENDDDLSIYNEETQCVKKGLYYADKLSQKDKYLVFLGGNYSRIRITDGSGSRPTLLLVKDSFANSIIPFLARHFDLDVIDPRYYSGSISAIAEQNGYENILLLFGVGTLKDTKLTLN